MDRLDTYDKPHCWQYDIRLNNLDDDIARSGLSKEIISNIKIEDFTFHVVNKKNPLELKEVKDFIERHEWLGTMSLYPSHIFTARYKQDKSKFGKSILAGVIVMDMPANFSQLLGGRTRKLERLVSRGACISWSPKNLASWLLMKSIRWMVRNTPYRLFTAYSDPEAKELGTIYQACNFIYLGQTHGTGKKYRYKDGGDKWFSDRSFRSRSAYKRYAKTLGIDWRDEWSTGDTVHFNRMPVRMMEQLKEEMKRQYDLCDVRLSEPKHKYCYILGADGHETKKLKKLFKELNPNLVDLKYPKER